jgi:hypothetical protein
VSKRKKPPRVPPPPSDPDDLDAWLREMQKLFEKEHSSADSELHIQKITDAISAFRGVFKNPTSFSLVCREHGNSIELDRQNPATSVPRMRKPCSEHCFEQAIKSVSI